MFFLFRFTYLYVFFFFYLISGASGGRDCDGGLSETAWKYYISDGIVTGGHYNLTQGCLPFAFLPRDHQCVFSSARIFSH